MNENIEKHIVTIILAVLVAATVIISHGCYQYEATRREAMKQGLQQQPAPGGAIWVKPTKP